MKQYLELGQRILDEGQWLKIGNTERLTIFGHQMEFDLLSGFPIITTRKIWWRGVVEELLWFLNGSTNVKDLQDVGVHFWDANALPDGTIGNGYGRQWRNWNGEGLDQIKRCLWLLKGTPKSTRNVVAAWNPAEIGVMALPPCHFSFQPLSDGVSLTLVATMRSSDYPVGLPTNIASYALLTHILAQVSGLIPSRLIMQLSHVHVYRENYPQFVEQMKREPLPRPALQIDGELTPDLKAMKSKQFKLPDYVSHPAINYEMVVT